jgi:hypothetical protein
MVFAAATGSSFNGGARKRGYDFFYQGNDIVFKRAARQPKDFDGKVTREGEQAFFGWFHGG